MMTNPVELELEVGIDWVCKKCNHRQPEVDGEEWPEHCGELMKMQPWRQFHAVEKHTVPQKE